MKRNVLAMVAPAVVLSACAPSDSNVDWSYELDSAPSMAAAGNAVFMRSSTSDTVVKVVLGEQAGTPEEDAYSDLTSSEIDYIGVGESPGELVLTPDGRYLLTLTHQGREGGLAVISPTAKCSGEQPVDASCVRILDGRSTHDSLALSPDGRFAVSYISQKAADSAAEDIVNPNEIGIYDLTNMTARFATVGYNPQDFAFTHAETQPRLVATTSTKVVVVDLETGDVTSRELSSSDGAQFHPNGVVVTGDDHFALVTMENSSDLFTFDLSQASLPINILNLGGTPTSIVPSGQGTEGLVLYTNTKQVGVIHQEDLSIDIFSLASSVNMVLSPAGAEYAVFYDSSGDGRQLYYLDLDNERMDTYPVDNPCSRVEASPGGDVLVLFYSPEPNQETSGGLGSGYAVAILNLGQGDSVPTPIMVRDKPRDVVFVLGAEPALDQVFVPFDGTDSGVVGRFNLSSYDSLAIDVAPRPYAIAKLSDGRIVTAHESPLGFLSVFPADQPELVQFVHGFLTDGLM